MISAAQSTESLKQVGNWHAQLHLELSQRFERTAVTQRQHIGPYIIQRPFYPEDDGTAHIYLLHPPGGMVGGDLLELSVDVKEGAKALITSPSAGKVYQCLKDTAHQDQVFRVGSGAQFEWMPQEMIIFNEAKAKLTSRFYLADESSQLMSWDLVCFGRRASKEWLEQGQFEQEISVYESDVLKLHERVVFDAEDGFLQQSFGMAGFSVMGTMIMTCAGYSVDSIKDYIEELSEQYGNSLMVSTTVVKGLCIVRILAHFSHEARAVLSKVWQFMRPLILNKAAEVPRIWYT